MGAFKLDDEVIQSIDTVDKIQHYKAQVELDTIYSWRWSLLKVYLLGDFTNLHSQVYKACKTYTQRVG